MVELLKDCWVIVIDMLGFGDFDRLVLLLIIVEYVDNVLCVFLVFGVEQKVDLFGYYMGMLIVVEMVF